MRYNCGCQFVDRYATYIVATFIAGASGSHPTPPGCAASRRRAVTESPSWHLQPLLRCFGNQEVTGLWPGLHEPDLVGVDDGLDPVTHAKAHDVHSASLHAGAADDACTVKMQAMRKPLTLVLAQHRRDK